MPLHSHANSSERGRVLIAAPSGRALAQAARASGYQPLVADFFDDLDTRELGLANRLVEGDLEHGFDAQSLMASLSALSTDHDPIGVIYGAGFEDRADLLDELAAHWRLLGNAPCTVAQVKDPRALARLCTDLGIPHPEIRFDAPADPAAWLVKHAGGSGGVHVAAAATALPTEGGYYQRRVAGMPVSAMLLADGREAIVLGFSEQWAAPAPDQPWRFGGAARPARLATKLAEELTRAVLSIVEATRLVGLNSVDFLVAGEAFHLIEINPRPGATLDIFHDAEGELLHAHVEACHGHLPSEPLRFAAAEAASFVYAPGPIAAMPACDWPAWAADRQKPGSALCVGDPLCTVTARGPDLASARQLLDERMAQILILLKTQSERQAAA